MEENKELYDKVAIEYDKVAMDIRNNYKDNIAKVKEIAEVSKDIGVLITNLDGSCRPLFDILQDLAKIWEVSSK